MFKNIQYFLWNTPYWLKYTLLLFLVLLGADNISPTLKDNSSKIIFALIVTIITLLLRYIFFSP